MAKKTKSGLKGKEEKIEREYVIPLKKQVSKVPRYKKANKAIKTIKEFIARHMKIYDRDLRKIKIDKYLNEEIWHRGIRKPPTKIKVKAIKETDAEDKEIVRVELAIYPDKLKYKKLREEKLSKGAEEKKKKKEEEKAKKTEEAEKKETLEEKAEKEEEKKEEQEKKAAVVEAGKALEKQAAKTAKHETKFKVKEPKRQFRQALQK